MKTATPCGGIRSGSLAFPASSVALARYRAGLRGLPYHTATSDRSRPSGPLRLRLLFRALERSLPTLAGLLSWDSLELALVPPLRRHDRVASTPNGAVASATFGSTSPTSSPVPSPWFLATSTACSASQLAGLLHPAAGPGVHRVSRASRLTRHPIALARDGGSTGPIPTVLSPLEGFPSSAAVRRHRRLLPPCRSTFQRPSAALAVSCRRRSEAPKRC